MGAKVSSGAKDLSERDLAYLTQHTGLQREQVGSNIIWSVIQSCIKNTFHILYVTCYIKVLDYYGKFKKSGDPLKSPIDQAEFLEIMQVEKKTCKNVNLNKGHMIKPCKQICYPRTFHEDLAKDIFRLYDRDGNGSIIFKVTFNIIFWIRSSFLGELYTGIFSRSF